MRFSEKSVGGPKIMVKGVAGVVRFIECLVWVLAGRLLVTQPINL